MHAEPDRKRIAVALSAADAAIITRTSAVEGLPSSKLVGRLGPPARLWFGRSCRHGRFRCSGSDAEDDGPHGPDLGAQATHRVGGMLTAAEIVSAGNEPLRDAVEAVGFANDAKGLGKLLKRKEGQIIDGLRLELRADRKAKINRYGVANLQEPDFG
jgi:hypothetical protein